MQKIAGDNSLQPAADLQVGDRVLVTLRIETQLPGHFVAIDDPLPAILEAVNPEFRTQGADARETDRADYREIRAGRVLHFCNHVPAGAFTFRYLARDESGGDVPTRTLRPERKRATHKPCRRMRFPQNPARSGRSPDGCFIFTVP